jgi:ParB/RepB/Spo0J family partition protein
MKITSRSIGINKISVPPRRQRKDLGDLSGLKASILALGILNPIVVESDRDNPGQYLLIAGERRFRSAQELDLATVPIRTIESLTPDERIRIELEENIKRKQLDWQEEAKAVELYVAINPNQTQEQIAESLGVPQSYISRCVAFVRGAEEMPELKAASNLTAAVNIIKRKEQRKLDTLLDGQSLDDQLLGKPAAPAAPAVALPYTIQHTSFLTWASEYSGPRFNLLHCDFPYGLNMDSAPLQGRAGAWASDNYDDRPELYFQLLSCLLAHKDNIIADSAHVLFWLSLNFLHETTEAFTAAGFLVHPFPFIWGKSDGKSFLPDPQRWPRRGYEAALLISRGDRKIVQAKQNIVWEPTTKTLHLSEKPVPVVQHLMSMFCDESSRVLDPTCGSGTAILAAKNLKAAFALGLEIDPQHAAGATGRLNALPDPLESLLNV